MKNSILFALAIAFLFNACKSTINKTKETVPAETAPKEINTTDTSTKPVIAKPVAEQLYACSMHPEVTGKKNEKCSKCGMKLTEPIKN